MGYPVLDKEKIERLVYEIENTPLKRVAAELALARELVAACRRGYIPLAVQRVLSRIPKPADKSDWLQIAGLTPTDEPITDADLMRKDFE